MSPRFPNVRVRLSGRDGNAFLILGRMRAALERGGASSAEIAEFTAQAAAGDYDHLLRTCMEWAVVS